MDSKTSGTIFGKIELIIIINRQFYGFDRAYIYNPMGRSDGL